MANWTMANKQFSYWQTDRASPGAVDLRVKLSVNIIISYFVVKPA